MWLICPECNQRFFFEVHLIVMLKESFRLNPKLQIICTACGKKHELFNNYMHQIKKWAKDYRKDKKMQAEIETLFGSWAEREDITDDWLENMREDWDIREC